MLTISQNNKIAISALALFLVSFASIVFFLENGGTNLDSSHVNVLHSTDHGNSSDIPEADPEAFYRGRIGDIGSPIIVIDAEAKITFLSKSFCSLVDTKCELIVDDLFYDHINTKDLPEFASNITKIIQDKSESSIAIGPYRLLKGEKEILVLFNAFTVLDKDDKVSEIIFSVKDLTEQVEELNNNEEPDSTDKNWMQNIYPNIDEMNEQNDIRMVVDKIGYAK
jgi:PAS domain-containing protein